MRAAFLASAIVALTVPARAEVAPHQSAPMLVSSNGRAVVGYDVASSRVTSFLEHPYQARSDGSRTRDVAFDAYPGVRIGAAGTAGSWLVDTAPKSVRYEPGTGVIVIERELSGLSSSEYVFAPMGLAEHAYVNLVRVTRTSGGAVPVSGYSLFNFHLGSGAPEPSASGETTQWDAARDAWMEWGGSGLTLAYGALSPSAHHASSPDNPFTLLSSGADLTDNAGTGGSYDDAAAGLQFDLGTLSDGQSAWFGSFVVLDDKSDVAPRIDAVRAWVKGRTPQQLLDDEKAAWDAWHTAPPAGLSSTEAALYRQSMAVLRMGQVTEPGKGDGQILASLPPGMWNISWVRDMAYAVVALARSGHSDEVKKALAFQLGADSGKYQNEVGHPYQISITRYFGDGVEETDSNENGPNIEFDGFGLFLWTLDEYVEHSKDSASLQTWWPTVSTKVADTLVALQEPSGLIAADSSIWEVHWNGQQKHFAYTTLTAANGLCRAARLAEQMGDTERATTYRDAGRRARDALVNTLAAPDGTIAQSLEELNQGSGFLDAAAIEAVGMGLVDPTGRAAKATLAAMKSQLVPPSGRGFFRNDDGGWYDSQEWVFVDLRTVVAMRKMGDTDGAPLLEWNTGQGNENFNLISELHDAANADYRGEMPMVGFGAGTYSIALMDRESPNDFIPCGEYAAEGSGGNSGTGGAGGTSGAGGGAGGSSAAPKDEEDGGCGCRVTRTPSPASLLLAFSLLGIGALRRRGRRARDRS
ncbi:MAG: MYXO-CTERM sorting domain-containing protein [Polyangiaceae bacterium]